MEINSTPASCESNEFYCNNGQCLDESNRCNGRDDCGDYSDEINCGSYYACITHNITVFPII